MVSTGVQDGFHRLTGAHGARKLKLLYDTFEQVKFIVTGSSSLELSGGMGKFLVGRVFFFELLPFSFREFLVAKDERLSRVHGRGNEVIREFLRGEVVREFGADAFISGLLFHGLSAVFQ